MPDLTSDLISDTALLVIDVQESFKHTKYWQDDDFPRFQNNLTALIQQAHQLNWQLIYVLHNEDDGVFSPESGYVRLMPFLSSEPGDQIFNKRVHNAMTDSGLHAWLQDKKINKLRVCGIRTEQCCETTTRIASDLGYQVDYVLDATLTFPMMHPLTKEVVTPEQIYNRTALVLHQRFADITSVQDYY
ncbi:isochorismatase family protein [Oceanospirillum sediminis]|uniref:isochorismatase family protein n=1 Tax=Oceanospirillum sediminis TaxID=2760088 RepID=UPI001C723E0D|nr:isochorismatase family protein [Oceanospirillum sediminis]